MKSNRIIAAFLLLFTLAVSCKKEEESTTTSKSLTGTLSIGEIPAYVKTHTAWYFEVAEPLEVDDTDKAAGVEVSYNWTVSGCRIIDSTALRISILVDDEPGDVSVKCSSEASGYYSKSASVSFTSVSQSSLNIDWTKVYAEINGKTWKALNQTDTTVCGVAYANQPALIDIFGAFYTAADVATQTLCASGWHVPSLDEFKTLFEGGNTAGDLMAKDAKFNGAVLWNHYADDVFRITNSTGFTALPFGYATELNGTNYFYGFAEYAAFWALDGALPVSCQIYADEPDFTTFYPPQSGDFRANLRCVKD